MKKKFACLLAVMSILGLAGCTGTSSGQPSSQALTSKPSDTSKPSTPSSTPEEPVDDPTKPDPEGHVLGTEGLEYTLSDDETYYTLTSIGTCTEENIVVGNWHEGLPVTEIGEAALKSDTVNVKSIIVSEGITTLGFRALRNSTVEFISLPNGIETLTKATFILDKALKSVVIGKGVKTIEDDVFMEISLPDIYFRGTREEWQSIDISASNNDLSNTSFHYEYVDGERTDGIVDGSEGLQYTLSDDETYYTLTSIGTCTEKDIVVANTYEGLPVLEIGEACLSSDTVEINSITVPRGITTLGFRALRSPTVKHIYLPNGIETLTKATFILDKQLEDVVIGKGVKTIEDDVFMETTVKDIYFRGTEEEWKAIDISELNNDLSKTTIHYNYVG